MQQLTASPASSGDVPSPAGVEMAVAVDLTVVAAWTAIEGMQLRGTAEVYIGEHSISRNAGVHSTAEPDTSSG